MNRRDLIRGAGCASLLPFVTTLVALLPRDVQARAVAAFEAKTARDALDALFEGARIETSDALELIAPDIAEDGAAVPLEIRTTLKGIDTLAVVATENPRPLVASFRFTERSGLPVDLRIRLAGSQEVMVIARANGRIYRTGKLVQVTIGACGAA